MRPGLNGLGGGGMVNHYHIHGAGMHHTRILYLAVFSVASFASPELQAETPSKVAKYTLQREGPPESVSSISQAGRQPKIERYTQQREKTPEFLPSVLKLGQAPEIEITEQSGAYQIKVVAVLDAPAHYVRYVLTDYTHIYRLNPSIIESEVVERHDDGAVNVRTKVIGCAAYFCEELDRVEKVRQLPSGDLYAEIIPEQSQFKSGQTLWRVKELGDHCEVSYYSDMEPDVFIPPVVGKFLIKRSIREELQTSFANLEKISTVLAERERKDRYQLAERQWQEDYLPEVGVMSGVPCNPTASVPFSSME